MILSALVLFCCSNLPADTPRAPETPPAIESKSAITTEPTVEVATANPDAPLPKVAGSSKTETEYAGGEAITPGSQPLLNAPVKPATTESYETPRKRIIWYGLMAASHGTAAFDAWTTRRAISGGYGVESDPLQRPFAHSGAIYATTQVTPVIMDYLGHRMMRSSHPWIRNAWWIPQAASASVSLGAGVHNYRVVP
jgi:hypothetical protein